MIYVTSDQHFNHQRIIAYAKRPHRTVEDMDRDLIRRFINGN